MRMFLSFVVLALLVSSAEARPTRARSPGGDVKITISLREQVVTLVWLNSVDPPARTVEETHDLVALFDALSLDEARAYVEAHKDVSLASIPDDPKPRSLTKGEARALVTALEPNEKHPQPLSFARVLSGFRDAVTDALKLAESTNAKKGTP